MNHLLRPLMMAIYILAMLVGNGLADEPAPKLVPGSMFTVTFPDMPPIFYGMDVQKNYPAKMTVFLPRNYDPARKHPLFIFLDGGHGSTGDDPAVARKITEEKDFICLNVPLFKAKLDPLVPGKSTKGRLFMRDEDGLYMWPFFKKMLNRLEELVPNIDPDHRILGGFSNGAHATAAMINTTDGEAARRFTTFFLVEGGGGLQRFDLLKGKPLFILYGAKNGGAWADRLSNAAIESDVKAEVYGMPNTGHDFPAFVYPRFREWLRGPAMGLATPEIATQPAAAPAPVSTGKSATEEGAMDTLKTFAELMKLAGIFEQGEGPMTFFAPTDAAFAAMPKDRLNALKQDPKAVKDLLLNLIVQREINPMSLPSAGKMQTLGGGMLTASPVKAAPSDAGPLGLAMVNGAMVLKRIPVSRGRRIYLLDKVVFAEKPAAELAKGEAR